MLHEVLRLLRVQRLAVKRSRIVQLDEEEQAERLPMTPGGIRLFLEAHRPLVYRAEALLIGSLHSSSEKKNKPSSSAIEAGCQSKRMTRTDSDEEGMKIF